MRIALPIRISIVLLILGWCLAIALAGCMTEKKVTRWNDKHYEKAAKYCAKEFPIKETIVVRDSVHFDTLYREGLHLIDTVFIEGKPVVIRRQCPPNEVVTKYVTKEVTKIQKDSAEAVLLRTNISVLQGVTVTQGNEIAVLKDKAKEAKEARSKWRTRCLITWGIILLFVAAKVSLPFKI